MASSGMKFAVALLILAISHVRSDRSGVPVMIWGNKIPYVPPAYAGHTTSVKEFAQNYVKEMVKPSHNVVVFVQDKLSVEDFTQMADVYNENSNGGILDNLRALVENNPSVHLPSVSQAASTLNDLVKTFDGRVHQMTGPYNVDDLKLDDTSANLVMVKLPSTMGTSDEQIVAFKKIDDTIGAVSEYMKQLSVPYLAFYTAEKPSMEPLEEENYLGRHLLATGEQEENSATIINNTCVLMYIEELVLYLTKPKVDDKQSKISYTIPINESETEVNCSQPASIVFKYDNATTQIMVKISLKEWRDFWKVSEIKLKANVTEKKNINATMNVNIFAPKNYSYHCSGLNTYANISVAKIEDDSSKDYIPSLFFRELQLQFYPGNNMGKGFGKVNDCVGFFNAAIWMGLVCTLVLGLILAFGICMLSNIHTMDRFDDPKGKTISVNVAD